MSSSATFLRALARQLSTASLYGAAHPMLERGLASAFEELHGLIEGGAGVVFEIHADRVLCDGREVTDLGAGPWRARFVQAGVERVAFEADMDARAFVRRFHELARELGLYEGSEEVVAPSVTDVADLAGVARDPGGVAQEPGGEARDPEGVGRDPGGMAATQPVEQANGRELDEEAGLIHWMHGQIANKGRLPSAEARRVAERLCGVMPGEPPMASSLLLAPADGYTTSHCLNVALMAGALAGHLEYEDDEIELVTEAALLHDIGKVRLPLEDAAPDGLTPEQRSIMEQHPSEGARVLFAAPARHTLSAVVAYEHHMAWQGETGYPVRHYPRSAHRFSRLVQICDGYDVLRSRRPFRSPLSHEAALEYMRLQASTAFDPDLVTAFADLCEARPLPRIPDPAADERELGTVELSRLPDGLFDADTEIPPIRL